MYYEPLRRWNGAQNYKSFSNMFDNNDCCRTHTAMRQKIVVFLIIIIKLEWQQNIDSNVKFI